MIVDENQPTSDLREAILSKRNLETLLVQKLHIKLPINLKQFRAGQSNPTLLVEDAKGQKYVIRKKPNGSIISTAHNIKREYTVLAALSNTSVPVPKMFLYCTDTKIFGTEFYVMEFVQGRIFFDPFLSSVSKAERKHYYFSLIDTLAALHSIDYSKVGLANFGRNGGFYLRQFKTLVAVSMEQALVKNDTSIVGKLLHFDEITKWIGNNMINDEVCLMHGDYKMDNVIFDPKSTKIIGVLDWELSTIGHPLADLANMFIPLYINYVTGDLNPDSEIREKLGFGPEDLLEKYCIQMKRRYPIKGWAFCQIFGLFKVLTINQDGRDHTRSSCTLSSRTVKLAISRSIYTNPFQTGKSSISKDFVFFIQVIAKVVSVIPKEGVAL